MRFLRLRSFPDGYRLQMRIPFLVARFRGTGCRFQCLQGFINEHYAGYTFSARFLMTINQTQTPIRVGDTHITQISIFLEFRFESFYSVLNITEMI